MKEVPFYPAQFVISAKHLPWTVRLRDLILTIFIWGLYLYFMHDFAIFARDASIWIYHGFDDIQQYPGLKILEDVSSFIKLVAFLVFLLVGWSYYNIIRYGKKNRRLPALPLEIERSAEAYELNPVELATWQNARILIMRHDDHGRLYNVTKV